VVSVGLVAVVLGIRAGAAVDLRGRWHGNQHVGSTCEEYEGASVQHSATSTIRPCSTF
jgi:hypothetical protein